MFRGWFVVSVLLGLFGAAGILGIGAIFLARGGAARTDAAAATVLAVAMACVGLGWAPLATGLLEVVLAVVFAWFAAGTFRRKARPEGTGRFPSVYGAAVTALAGWVLLSAAGGGGSATEHPGHELGAILLDLMGALLMVFTAAGWLLSAFAMPAESKPHPVPRLTGTREALLAAGLAVAFYAIS